MIGCSSFFDHPEAAIEARGQKWRKKIVRGNNIVEIFLQTEFQKHWGKDKEMTGIFHYFSFFHRKHETRPLCSIIGTQWNEFSLSDARINSRIAKREFTPLSASNTGFFFEQNCKNSTGQKLKNFKTQAENSNQVPKNSTYRNLCTIFAQISSYWNFRFLFYFYSISNLWLKMNKGRCNISFKRRKVK